MVRTTWARGASSKLSLMESPLTAGASWALPSSFPVPSITRGWDSSDSLFFLPVFTEPSASSAAKEKSCAELASLKWLTKLVLLGCAQASSSWQTANASTVRTGRLGNFMVFLTHLFMVCRHAVPWIRRIQPWMCAAAGPEHRLRQAPEPLARPPARTAAESAHGHLLVDSAPCQARLVLGLWFAWCPRGPARYSAPGYQRASRPPGSD